MKSAKRIQQGFTLVEIAIVLLIVTILLGYTVAMFPRQQELKQYRAVKQQMDEVIEAIIGFAQVNGRLPCPALPNSTGNEDYDAIGDTGCNNYAGFVPVNTLGLDGRFNEDSLLIDPWGNPYRYYVTDADFNRLPAGSGAGNGLSDFTAPGEMRAVGLVDTDNAGAGDGYIDLDGRYLICDSAGSSTDDRCSGANTVFGKFTDNGPPFDRYGGAPLVLLSMGKNWSEAPAGDELENSGNITITGPSGTDYLLKDVASGETTFVRRPGGLADDFDDVVRWVSPSLLFSRMIQADQLP
ncbi:MAG TPA: type II secretion system protein [Gammaproteobacteria bacterium]|nr:type II secretion system protein [Gammaproteobacteria bacterium]